MPTPVPTWLQDNLGGTWLLTINDAGNVLSTTSSAGTPIVAAITLQDIATGAVYDLTVDSGGAIQTSPSASISAPTQFLLSSTPSGIVWGLQIVNGVRQTVQGGACQQVAISQRYTYITFATAKQLLANRLYDITKVFWKDPELGMYIVEALRTWNAITAQWVTEYTFNVDSSSPQWISLNSGCSPRAYTLTDSSLYTLIEYHLLEPPTGSFPWQGTPQFSVSDLTQGFQRRQDEMISTIAMNVSQVPSIVLPPGSRRVLLPEQYIDVRRARYVPSDTTIKPQNLWRGDTAEFGFFSPAYRQTQQKPRCYAVSAQPPLTFDVDYPPNIIGSLDILAVRAGAQPVPPNPVILSVPDDWAWVVKWGILGDMLGKESEARDDLRLQYSNARYYEGLQLAAKMPWVLGAFINDVPVGIDAVSDRDTYDPSWETNASARRGIVIAGTDLLSVCPRPAGATVISVTLQVVQAAPVPVFDSDFIQASREVFDLILDYAFHLATFKEAGEDFMSTMPLFDNFRKGAAQMSSHLEAVGPFLDVMKAYGARQELSEGR